MLRDLNLNTAQFSQELVHSLMHSSFSIESSIAETPGSSLQLNVLHQFAIYTQDNKTWTHASLKFQLRLDLVICWKPESLVKSHPMNHWTNSLECFLALVYYCNLIFTLSIIMKRWPTIFEGPGWMKWIQYVAVLRTERQRPLFNNHQLRQ